MTNTHPARTGTTFSLAPGHSLYIGPDRDGRGPVLAVQDPGSKKPVVVARFSNSTAAERTIATLKEHVDALAPLASPDPAGQTEDAAPARGE